jgi:hypothetical protein
MIWYHAVSWSTRSIEPVEVTTVKEKSLVLAENGMRVMKDTEHEWYRPSFIEARQALIDDLVSKRDGLIEQARMYDEKIAKAMALTDGEA